ncbi:unnamed protein product [Protopolystoma xenopodis]|uniref:Uncharacterized protein n=1 Tax=Protopolystoma xenopodis TaxID=117903 RepID=A0A448XGT3_9PLAT|nr:unnamed protein product [Protopolystoma xenopodis]
MPPPPLFSPSSTSVMTAVYSLPLTSLSISARSTFPDHLTISRRTGPDKSAINACSDTGLKFAPSQTNLVSNSFLLEKWTPAPATPRPRWPLSQIQRRSTILPNVHISSEASDPMSRYPVSLLKAADSSYPDGFEEYNETSTSFNESTKVVITTINY